MHKGNESINMYNSWSLKELKDELKKVRAQVQNGIMSPAQAMYQRPSDIAGSPMKKTLDNGEMGVFL